MKGFYITSALNGEAGKTKLHFRQNFLQTFDFLTKQVYTEINTTLFIVLAIVWWNTFWW